MLFKYSPKLKELVSVWLSKKKHFVDFCLSYLNDEILKGFDKVMMTDIILIDMKKSFDTIGKNYVIWVFQSI